MRRFIKLAGLTAAAALVSGAALAHTGAGHADGFAAGLAHPILGPDHLLAMLSVGVWSAMTTPKKSWIAPVAFVTAMLAGAGLSFGGIGLPAVEGMIASSVLVLGLMVGAGNRMATSLGVALCGLFALFHGHAHASEAAGGVFAYIAGFTLATGFIHVTGIGIGKTIAKNRFARFTVGGAMTTAGAFILAGL